MIVFGGISGGKFTPTEGAAVGAASTLVAALVKTQGKQRFATEVLTNASGFTGIDGLFRFRPDGTNQRGLAVLRVSPTGGPMVSSPPKGFTGQGT